MRVQRGSFPIVHDPLVRATKVGVGLFEFEFPEMVVDAPPPPPPPQPSPPRARLVTTTAAAAATTTTITVEGVRRGTRHLQAAEPRRREGWGHEGAHRGTRHVQRNPGGKKGMLRRAANRTRARPRKRPKLHTSAHACRHHPWPAPNCPQPPRPKKFRSSTASLSSRAI